MGERTSEVEVSAPAEHDEVETARAQIEQTRAEMSETIDAIQEKVSPEHLKEQAKVAIREATVTKATEAWSMVRSKGTEASSTVARRAQVAGSAVGQRVQQEPIPFAVAGMIFVGLGVVLALLFLRPGKRQSASGEAG